MQIYLVLRLCSKTTHNASQAVRLTRIYAADLPAFLQPQYPPFMQADSPHLRIRVQFPLQGNSANTERSLKKVFTLLRVGAISIICIIAFTPISISLPGLHRS